MQNYKKEQLVRLEASIFPRRFREFLNRGRYSLLEHITAEDKAVFYHRIHPPVRRINFMQIRPRENVDALSYPLTSSLMHSVDKLHPRSRINLRRNPNGFRKFDVESAHSSVAHSLWLNYISRILLKCLRANI